MRVWIFDTALPIPLGGPRQRRSEGLRQWIAARAETQHVTIDVHGSEAAFRLYRAKGDLFLPQRGRSHKFEPKVDHENAWLSPSRRRHLRGLLIRNQPDLVVIADPLLAPLVPEITAARCPVHLIKDGEADWNNLIARQLHSTNAAAWHQRMASLLHASTSAFAPLLHTTPFPGARLSFSSDERFFEKISGIVALATGYPDPDRRALVQIDATMKAFAARGLPKPDLTLIGFHDVASSGIEGAMVHDNWAYLEALVGSTRVLMLPVLSPALAAIADAALELGTPVVTTPADAAQAGLSGIDGVFAVLSDEIPALIARLLDDDLTGEADWRAIAEASQMRRACDAPLALIPELTGPVNAVAPHRRRIAPVLRHPEVFYNALTQMLLVRLHYRRDAGVEDVRLIDDSGTELIRLMANVNEKRLDPVRVEGGVVANPDALGGALTIELHDVGGCLQQITIPVSEFTRLEAEIACAYQDGVMLKGAFWLADAAAPPETTAGFVLSNGENQADLVEGTCIEMPEIGGQARTFSVPLGLAARTPVHVERRAKGVYRSIETLEQRALMPTPALISAASEPSPELAALRDKHRGKRGWIIGNGPSVQLEDLAAIPQDDVKFCFNRFYLSYDQHPLREDYVVSADTLMIADFGQEMIERSTGLPLFCLARAALGRLEGPHVVLTPFDGYLPLFSMDPAAFISVGGSSVCVALQMAHYMGLRDIVLYGLDYSFSMKLQFDPRFPFPVSYDDGNHFITSYRSARPWCPPTWRDISTGFLNARVAFETTGGRVRNATRGGRLETFTRVDFDALMTEETAS